MYLSTSTSTRAFSEMYLSTFRVLYKLYLSTDVLKYNVLVPGSDKYINNTTIINTSSEYICRYYITVSIWDASHWDASNWNASYWNAEN